MYLNQTKLRRDVLEPLTTSCARYPLLYIRHTLSVVICSSESKHMVQWNFPGQFLSVCIGAKIHLSLS